MNKNRQNDFPIADEDFSSLDALDRSQENKERTKHRVTNTLRKQKASYRPFILTLASALLVGILSLSIIPTMTEQKQLNYNSDKTQEYYTTSHQNENVWVATINVIPAEVKYEDYNQREYGDVIIYYKKIGEDILNLAFHMEGDTYTIMYNLSHDKDENKAFLLAEEEIDKVKK